MELSAAPFDPKQLKKSFNPYDTFFVFMGQEFLYLDYVRDTWAIGDVTQMDKSLTFSIPENASVVKVDRDKHPCEHTHAFVIGGVDRQGNLLNWAFGLEFQSLDGGMDLRVSVSYTDPSLVLPV